ncbi:SDR family oxidoreductase [Brevibacterium casei]|uniref:NADP-dependent 3-hydroxy acid dehydrogenase YdfG n=1 Tax=Brevibacterium casei CIP 102111 TaxID=1255625 RepID=A0A2H1JLH7_9MICO|nr:SDR family NAD(P)-dependent oxidoreductase [Brevibacterium casei]QPR39272.1 SDR family NAD(P)-dependent oxidoreductase [Brevibacterium casei]QPR43438.1 SDR family NAD(P)-dependent oxidoreductase [Brevibacterium casei]SMX88271.1 NADP-dependent 3-hydroxy acid dehydrogenase YdfG [Brevibacterium casei CIP 102111]
MTDTAQAPPEERIALVTGATGAIGAAVSRTLVGQGIRTAMLARNLRRLERLAEQLDAPDLTLPVRADVTQPFDLVEARDAIRDGFGADPDLVMVSAGVMRAGDFEQAVPSEWKAMIMTNVEGALYTAQTFADGLLRIGETGHRADLIFVGSAPAPQRAKSYAVFSAMATSVEQLAKHLRAEYGERGVRVHHIAPFYVTSELGADMSDTEHYQRFLERADEFSSIDPGSVAHLVKFMIGLPARSNLAAATIRPVRS